MKKIMIVLGIISIVLVILLSVGHYIILSHINQPGATYWNDSRMVFENDTGKDILVKAYFAEGLLDQVEIFHQKPQFLLPYLTEKKSFFSSFFNDKKGTAENKYIFDKYPIEEKFFSVLVPSDTTLFFGEWGLKETCPYTYSHFEFAMMENGETMKSAGIQFDRWCEMKLRCLAPNSRTKCPMKASEVFRD